MNNFILEHMIDLSLCDELIEYHKKSPDKVKGRIFDENGSGVDPETKISTDVFLLNPNLAQKYFAQLHKCVENYLTLYPWSGAYSQWKVIEDVNIQHYKPNEGFFAWHTERTGPQPPITYRHLVFMTYLNDITDGGETEFFHQNIKYTPKKGNTLIWPADWTHTHRGIPSSTQEKYIATGWFSYF
jgi:prolyl 4-hydroxylase